MPDLMSDRIRLQFMIESEKKRDRPSLAMIERWELAIKFIDNDKRNHKSYIENAIPPGDE